MNTEIENSATCEVQLLLQFLNAKNVVHVSHSQGIATLPFVAVSRAALQTFTCLPC
jgi:hypothetical protein